MSVFSDVSNQGQWWGVQNKQMLPLHALNKLRLEYIKGKVANLQGVKILDYGCGGGLLCEPLARHGAKVVGFDENHDCINAAQSHAKAQALDIFYSSLDPQASHGLFDIVCCFEVLEHVEKPDILIKQLVNLVKKDGLIFVSTINKNLASLLLVKFAAEYLLKIAPRGLHDADMFIEPRNLIKLFAEQNCSCLDIAGVNYNPISKAAKLSGGIKKHLTTNYISYFIKS
jgi:2-polyprenyl-6-hydroxyphenyl methylase/3-demethylubiquinone-9 3-methyltransferase